MLKLVGAIMIILSGTGMGFQASERLFRQNELLKRLKKMIVLLRGEIKYNNTYLGQALENVSGKISEPYSTFLQYLAQRSEENEGESFAALWRESVTVNLQESGLSKQHLERLVELGETLGFLDREMQLAAIDLFMEQLETMIGENSLKLRDNSRLYRCLGVMGGILVVLVIT